uniref:Uncharacterized protein n=1 Tax=Eutreptiella gymnastica TaxID=73025 RepID=A0A7S1NA00_9EUGL|mmetsp:Transcript_145269/g.253481  ORF Transcript_145269/g.253481 Transcript_145269/m.253481 type:complete len:505 (+) Transcript_145269:27-1541(+)
MAEPTFDAPWTDDDFQWLFQSQREGATYELLDADVLEGQFPVGDLVGTYYHNGPSIMELQGDYMHPFEGHALIRTIRFAEAGKVTFKSAVVETQAYKDEVQDAGQLLWRGYGPNRSWWSNFRARMTPKNVANTCVIEYNGKVLAGFEGTSAPHILDPATLATIGQETFQDTIPVDRPFLAHTRYDAKKGVLVGASLMMGKDVTMTMYEIKDGKCVDTTGPIQLDVGYVHDFLITENYYVFLTNFIKLNPFKLVKALAGFGSLFLALIANTARNGQVILVPRPGSKYAAEGIKTYEAPHPLFTFHPANAFETESPEGKPVAKMYACSFQNFKFGNEFGFRPCKPGSWDPRLNAGGFSQAFYEFTCDLESSGMETRVLDTRSVDFPEVHPEMEGQKTKYAYTAGCQDPALAFPFQKVIKYDLESGSAVAEFNCGAREFLGEPVYAPRKGYTAEDDGYVLTYCYAAEKRSVDVCILNATDLALVCRLATHQQFPYGFHGGWSPVVHF